jgi:hypothetical protein
MKFHNLTVLDKNHSEGELCVACTGYKIFELSDKIYNKCIKKVHNNTKIVSFACVDFVYKNDSMFNSSDRINPYNKYLIAIFHDY